MIIDLLLKNSIGICFPEVTTKDNSKFGWDDGAHFARHKKWEKRKNEETNSLSTNSLSTQSEDSDTQVESQDAVKKDPCETLEYKIERKAGPQFQAVQSNDDEDEGTATEADFDLKLESNDDDWSTQTELGCAPQAPEDDLAIQDELDNEISMKTKPEPSFFNFDGFEGNGRDCKYFDVVWNELTTEARGAAMILGWTEEEWNNDGWAYTETKYFEELGPSERHAAKLLGWDKPAWDHAYEETEWMDLPPHVRRAAKSVGFDHDMWDESEWPEDSRKPWDELCVEDRNAYATMGWYKTKWDQEL